MTDLWLYLQRAEKPIFLYGTGNGADKIIDVCESRGITLSGVFASDGFVRDRVFRGMKVRSYSDVTTEYGDGIIVLLAFGTTRAEVLDFIEKLDERHELYIPEVPLYGGELFDSAYFENHRKQLDSARSTLSDERSRSLFDDAVNFRLTGKRAYLADTEPMEVTLRTLFSDFKGGVIVDGGAYKGDSAAIFAECLHPDIILALEADPKTAIKLADYAKSETRTEVHAIHAALWSEDGELSYSSSGSRGAGESGQNRRATERTVPAVTLDTLLASTRADFIKLDIEGAEHEAIRGGKNVILRDQPSMAVSLYHRTDDLWALPLMLRELLPEHRFYLRRVPCIPMWDLTLYAIK